MDLLRHVLPHLAAGGLGGVTAAAGLIATNVGSLRDLMAQSEDGWIGGLLLAFGFATTLAAAAAARGLLAAGGR
jgi:hypothetical protein